MLLVIKCSLRRSISIWTASKRIRERFRNSIDHIIDSGFQDIGILETSELEKSIRELAKRRVRTTAGK